MTDLLKENCIQMNSMVLSSFLSSTY